MNPKKAKSTTAKFPGTNITISEHNIFFDKPRTGHPKPGTLGALNLQTILHPFMNANPAAGHCIPSNYTQQKAKFSQCGGPEQVPAQLRYDSGEMVVGFFLQNPCLEHVKTRPPPSPPPPPSQSPPPPPTPAPPSKDCPDIKKNGKIDIEDLLLVLASFGQTCKSSSSQCGKSDLDGNKKVNIEDLLLLLAAYGKTCKASSPSPPTPTPTPTPTPSRPPPPPGPKDCAGVPGGKAKKDNCGVCDALPCNDCVKDCKGTWGGGAEVDNCGVCGGSGGLKCNIDWSKKVFMMPFMHAASPSFGITLESSSKQNYFEGLIMKLFNKTFDAPEDKSFSYTGSVETGLCIQINAKGKKEFKNDCNLPKPKYHIKGLLGVEMTYAGDESGESETVNLATGVSKVSPISVSAISANTVDTLVSEFKFLPSSARKVIDTITSPVVKIIDATGIQIKDLELGSYWQWDRKQKQLELGMSASGGLALEKKNLPKLPKGKVNPMQIVMDFMGKLVNTVNFRSFTEFGGTPLTKPPSAYLQHGFGTGPICLDDFSAGKKKDQFCDIDSTDSCKGYSTCKCKCKVRLDDREGGGLSVYSGFESDGADTGTNMGMRLGMKLKTGDEQFLHFVGTVEVEAQGVTASVGVGLTMYGVWEHAFGIPKLHMADAVVAFSMTLPITPASVVPQAMLLGASVFMGEQNYDKCMTMGKGKNNKGKQAFLDSKGKEVKAVAAKSTKFKATNKCIELGAYMAYDAEDPDKAFMLVYGTKGPTFLDMLDLFVPPSFGKVLENVKPIYNMFKAQLGPYQLE